MKWNEALSYYGESDEAPDCIAGDLIFVLRPKEEEIPELAQYQRKGDDLYLEKTLSFVDALTGTNFTIKNLRGKDMYVQFPDPINPGDILCLPRQGMPVHGKVKIKGDLFIKFVVTFPSKITDHQKNVLMKAFHKTHQAPPVDSVTLQKVTPKEKQKNNQNQRNNNNSDDEDGQDRPGVQCAQQ